MIHESWLLAVVKLNPSRPGGGMEGSLGCGTDGETRGGLTHGHEGPVPKASSSTRVSRGKIHLLVKLSIPDPPL